MTVIPVIDHPPRRPRQSLNFQLRAILHHNRDGSFAIQRKREQVLRKFFKDLRAAGYLVKKVANLLPKHVEHQVAAWKCACLGPGTMKNNMAILRWLCCKIGRPNMLPSNDELGIERRVFVGEDKAWDDEAGAMLLATMRERHKGLWLQMRLMREFGLRFKEAALLRPHLDVQGLTLQVTRGTKGGRDRVVPIRNDAQLDLLQECQAHVKRAHDSMTPWRCDFKNWRDMADNRCKELGMTREERTNFHALRHRYAQERYQELTGYEAPCRMSAEERAAAPPAMRRLDRQARAVISEELGHGRIAICRVYLGSPLR